MVQIIPGLLKTHNSPCLPGLASTAPSKLRPAPPTGRCVGGAAGGGGLVPHAGGGLRLCGECGPWDGRSSPRLGVGWCCVGVPSAPRSPSLPALRERRKNGRMLHPRRHEVDHQIRKRRESRRSEGAPDMARTLRKLEGSQKAVICGGRHDSGPGRQPTPAAKMCIVVIPSCTGTAPAAGRRTDATVLPEESVTVVPKTAAGCS